MTAAHLSIRWRAAVESLTRRRNGDHRPYSAAPRGIVGAGGTWRASMPSTVPTCRRRRARDRARRPHSSGHLVRNAGDRAAPRPPPRRRGARLASRMNAIPVAVVRNALLASLLWTPAERPWLVRLESLIETTWGGRHSFFLNRPRWNWLGASVRVDLSTSASARRRPPTTSSSEIYKTRQARFAQLRHLARGRFGSTTDPADQTMRLASTSRLALGSTTCCASPSSSTTTRTRSRAPRSQRSTASSHASAVGRQRCPPGGARRDRRPHQRRRQRTLQRRPRDGAPRPCARISSATVSRTPPTVHIRARRGEPIRRSPDASDQRR